ncbi:MAG TPA: hypothetical protein VJH87_20830 [Vicinamibacteria bacterium]|nr:hypothetical protein [Vicinamibacteria bacterium]
MNQKPVRSLSPYLLLSPLSPFLHQHLVTDFVVDDRPEGFERLRPGKEPAVDEERRRSRHTQRLTLLIVLLDRFLELPRIEALAEGAHVELKVGGDLTIGLGRKRALVLEDAIMILPELSLFVGAKPGLGGRLGFGVVGKREIAVDESDFFPVGLFNLL